MKYIEKYPCAVINEEVEPGIIRVEFEAPCFTCGTLSGFIDSDFEEIFCSEECNRGYGSLLPEEAEEDALLEEEGFFDENTDNF